MNDKTSDARVAVLEQIARSTETVLTDLRIELRSATTDLRTEMRLLRTEAKADYRWLIGIMLGGFTMTLGGFASILTVMAHGFKWI